MRVRQDEPRRSAQKGTGTDWGVVFHKIQQLRRAGKVDEAAKLLRTAPLDPQPSSPISTTGGSSGAASPMLALKANKPKLAYEVVRDAGPLSVNELNDQTFMAGWIALRYLKDVKQAREALRRSRAHRRRPAQPWARALLDGPHGRSAGRPGARAHQLPGGGARDRHVPWPARHAEAAARTPGAEPSSRRRYPTPTAAERFTNHNAAKAIALARKAELGRSVTRVFLLNLAKIEKNEAWAAMAAHFARVTGDTQTAVRIGKAAIANGQNLVYYSYPVHALPKYTPLRPPPETAMLMGLARQETEFNSDTVSSAGAAGILQVMKVTANHICRDYKIKCTHDALLTDNSYNIMIASAYVADRMAEWQGSYVLALSSYNAGPGRTRQWIKEFGDPRTAAIDPIDWIERIPIEETRRYVAKVLSNIQIYRARLGDEATALRLDEDLNRARTASNATRAGRHRAQDEHGELARLIVELMRSGAASGGRPVTLSSGREVRLDDDVRRSLRGHLLHLPRRAAAARAPLSGCGRHGPPRPPGAVPAGTDAQWARLPRPRRRAEPAFATRRAPSTRSTIAVADCRTSIPTGATTPSRSRCSTCSTS